MSIPKLTTDLNIIQKLSDLPNSTEGLTAEQLKAKFDEGGLEIQRWVNEILIPAITAGNIPFPKDAGIDAETVEAAILAVRKQITDAASGAIVDGTVTKAKLAATLLERVYGGRSWISLNTPGITDNPDNDLPVGQIWLRPSFSVTNKDNGNWDVSGCEVTTQDGSYILHRVKDVTKEGIVLWGDNHTMLEYGITEENIIGYAARIFRGETELDCQSFRYRLYLWLWQFKAIRRVLLPIAYRLRKEKFT